MQLEEAWNNLKLKFTSRNDIPVTRAMITREEFEAINPEYQICRNCIHWRADNRQINEIGRCDSKDTMKETMSKVIIGNNFLSDKPFMLLIKYNFGCKYFCKEEDK